MFEAEAPLQMRPFPTLQHVGPSKKCSALQKHIPHEEAKIVLHRVMAKSGEKIVFPLVFFGPDDKKLYYSLVILIMMIKKNHNSLRILVIFRKTISLTVSLKIFFKPFLAITVSSAK